MSQDFVKGRTNNHLTFVMPDATDFATPESALSAAMKIKIYGKLRGATGVNFVSSGTGSLTNDLIHVGASALGIYTIALVKADLSDASAAWYDQYIASLSATGAAYQMLVVDGGIDASVLLVAASRMLVVQSMASDAASAAQQANSRVLLTQSLASDAHSAAAQANSRVLLVQSRLSDFDSRLVSDVSDLYSLLSQLNSEFLSRVTSAITTSSDIVSKIWGHATPVAMASRVLLTLSQVSDLQSKVSDVESNLLSFLTTTGTGLNASTMSDLRSAIAAVTVTISASDVSDIASAVVAGLTSISASDISDIGSQVWANAIGARVDSRVRLIQSMASDAASAAAQANSRVLLVQSQASDIYSLVSDLQSDFQSRVPKRVATDSQLSDLASDVKSAVAVASSRVLVTQSMASDAASAAQQANSRALVIQSAASDVLSAVTGLPTAKLIAHTAAVLVLVVGAGSTTTAVKFSTVEGGAPSAVDDFYKDRVIVFTSGALAGQATSITSYVGATTTATVPALTAGPANAVTAVIV